MPAGLAVGNDLVFVSDSATHRVMAYDANTLKLSFTIGKSGKPGGDEGQFDSPMGLALHRAGHPTATVLTSFTR